MTMDQDNTAPGEIDELLNPHRGEEQARAREHTEDLLARRGIEIDLARLPWDDPAVYTLLQSGNTVGVFQLESEGMRRTLAAVKPDSFGDIVALVSLYRPGPMDNIPMFGARQPGVRVARAKIARVSPRLYPPDSRGCRRAD